MIDFEFNKEEYLVHKGRENLTKKNLNGTQPLFIFLLDKEENVLYFDWGMTSSVKKQTEEKAKEDAERYNPEWVIKNELSKEKVEKVKYLMTGYYDLLREKWNMLDYEEVGECLADSILDIMIKSKIKSSKIFYDDKELYMQNLKVIGSSRNAFLYNEDLENNIDIEEFLNLLINWYQNSKEVKKNTEGEYVVAPLSLVSKYLESNNVPEKNKEGKSNLYFIMTLMIVYDIMEIVIYNKKEERFIEYNELHNIKESDFNEKIKDFIEVPVFNERFKHLIK